MGSISSGLCYLQEVSELKVVWHPCPAATSCSPGLEWWLALQESLERDSLVLETFLQRWGSQCSQKRKRGQKREDLTLCFCLLFQIKPLPYKRHTPCSPNIS